MKTNTIIATSIIFVCLVSLFSCENNNTEKAETTISEQTDSAQYQCPMECEDKKTYSAPGECSVCEMELDKIK